MFHKHDFDLFEDLYNAVREMYRWASSARTFPIEEAINRDSEAVKRERENILLDGARALLRDATMRELIPGDPTRLRTSRAADLFIEAGASARVRDTSPEGISALKEELHELIDGMEIITNDGRPMAVMLKRRAR